MILHGIEVTKFRWNDKEVSVEEYQRLDEEWKQKCLEDELKEAQEAPGKNSRKSRTS